MAELTDTFVEVAACDISDQDFDLPCGITHKGEPCDKAAEWWAEFRTHCANDGRAFDLLLCTKHYNYVTGGGEATCRTCGERVRFMDHLLHLERIKP
jgi:hypothetical protein